MEAGEALAVLGVAEGASWADVRAAYRRLIRTTHPDVAGASRGADAARVTEAFAVLEAGRAAPPLPPRPPSGPEPVPTELVDGETIGLLAPPDEAFARLLAAAYDVFEVSYVDRSTGIIEAVVTPAIPGGQTSSLLITLQGRSSGFTEAFCTLEALGTGPTPPIEPVVATLVARLRMPARP